MHERAQQEVQEEAAEPIAAEAPTPLAPDLALASVVGNRAMTMAVAAQRGRAGARRVARQGVPAAPAAPNAPAEPEKATMTDNDKARARTTVVAPLRAGAEQLGAGPKANIGSIVRHVKPVRTAISGVKWAPPENVVVALQATDQLPAIIDLLESLKLTDRQVITKARSHWAAAKRDLAKSLDAMRKANVADAKHPDKQPREGAVQDMNAVSALLSQVDATIKDLAQSPRTQEGYKEVEVTAAAILDQFSTIDPIDDAGFASSAKAEFLEGVGALAPLALGKDEAIKQAQKTLLEMANALAGLVGDEPAEEPKEDNEPDPTANPTPPTPAPPGPNPLPPPPPPGGGAKAPAPAPAP